MRTMALAVWAIVVSSPASALDRARLQQYFDAPYSIGERDRDLPIWPVFKTTASREELVAYVFDYADFEPFRGISDADRNIVVAVRPSGEFIEVKSFRAESSALLDWFFPEPGFDFIRRDRAIAPNNSPPGSIEDSREFVRRRLGLSQDAAKAETTPFARTVM